jgi:sugar transferase (PEP-CTERM/EpsH1 system associated)
MHVVYRLDAGGMEMGVVKLVNGLDPGLIRSAICSTKPHSTLKNLVHPSVPLFELNRRDGNDPWLVRDLYRLFRRERPDIVHTHAWGTLIEGAVAARVAGVPVLIHGEHGTLQLRPYQRWLQRRAWSRVDYVLSVSERLADRIWRETGFPRQRLRVLRNGVDLSRFGALDRGDSRRALGLPAHGPVAVTVGRLVAVKDHFSLIDAVGILRRNNMRLVVAIAGDGPLRSALLERAAALDVSDAVRLLGHREDVERVFAAGDVFVLSSKSEGMSNTILEAMASRLPVVATRVGGADEMVVDGETGLLVPPRSPERLAAALGELTGDLARATQMGHAGRRRSEAEFSLEGMLRRYQELYLDTTRGRAQKTTAGVQSGA